MNSEAIRTFTEYWQQNGYADLARWNGDWPIVEILRESGLLVAPKREVAYTDEPPVPYEGTSCELHG